jgi:hypothetical protein
MKYYQVHYYDVNDPACSGVARGFYDSKEEAEKCAAWIEKHPEPVYNYRTYVQEIDLSEIIHTFEPTMTEEEYDEYCYKFFKPDEPDYEEYPDYDPDYEL